MSSDLRLAAEALAARVRGLPGLEQHPRLDDDIRPHLKPTTWLPLPQIALKPTRPGDLEGVS